LTFIARALELPFGHPLRSRASSLARGSTSASPADTLGRLSAACRRPDSHPGDQRL